MFPHPFDYTRVAVPVREVVIEGRDPVLLRSLVHIGQLLTIERKVIDIAHQKRPEYIEKLGAPCHLFGVITLFCPALQFHSAKPRSVLSPCTTPAAFLMHACFQTGCHESIQLNSAWERFGFRVEQDGRRLPRARWRGNYVLGTSAVDSSHNNQPAGARTDGRVIGRFHLSSSPHKALRRLDR
jgi:hypothetical protein